ncbi:S66 peptidase family protein [Anaerovorax odorimutans]|uniref:S66 peptidase family protein n=1 Tax=Anaerovorax odorimutans TaxID=109327 RepID=UPI0004050050|nr:LD-carboxypeptidase [Anaerovorax odorimutans]
MIKNNKKNKIIKPKTLKKGDRVALIAPSSPVTDKKFEISIKSIEFLNLEPVIFPTCNMKHGYLSGTDSARAKDVNDAFSDSSIDGIFCLRGGYGVTRILNMLDYKMIKNNPKLLLGYSDITGLHLALNKLCNMATLHAPMPTGGWNTLDQLSLQSLTDNIFTDTPIGNAPTPFGESIDIINHGKCEGIITGGNLSLLTATLGSPYEIDTKGKILFIEDVDEKHYRLDKGLTALALAGKFQDCKGIILGTWSDCCDPDLKDEDNLTLTQIFNEVIAPFKKPTINNFRAGHIYPHISIPMGTKVRLDADNGIVTFLESVTQNLK